jgi:hypothetical protein
MANGESADLREFIRTITLRIERVALAMDRKTDLLAEEMRANFGQRRELLDELLAENRAQREALFRILDRLDGGGTAPAT